MITNNKKIFKFTSIYQWINEQKSMKQTYGCVMMEPSKIKAWEELHLVGIDEKDLYEKINDDSYGVEHDPHITILYGIVEDSIDPSVIVDMMEQKMKPITVEINEIGVLENEEFDVVKYNVPVTAELKGYRDMFMKSFENKQTFDGYNPHVTIAYVKPGLGKKYKKMLDKPFKIKFNKGVYSYHKKENEPDLVRRVVNLEPKKESISSGVVKSKPLKGL
jgi:hypothetical protein